MLWDHTLSIWWLRGRFSKVCRRMFLPGSRHPTQRFLSWAGQRGLALWSGMCRMVGAAHFPKSAVIWLPLTLSHPGLKLWHHGTPATRGGALVWRRSLLCGWVLSLSLLPGTVPCAVMDDHGRNVMGGSYGLLEDCLAMLRRVDRLRPHPQRAGLTRAHEDPARKTVQGGH